MPPSRLRPATSRTQWLTLAFLLAAIMAVATVLDRPSLEYLPAFGIGALLASALPRVEALIRRINGDARHKLIWSLLALAAVLLLTARCTLGPHLPVRLLGTTNFPVALGATLFVFIALGSGLAKRFLTTRAVQWLGTISFSLYLTHEPIVVGVAGLLPRGAQDYTILIATPISLLVGWGFFLVIEKPAHRTAQWVRRRLTRETPAPAPETLSAA